MSKVKKVVASAITAALAISIGGVAMAEMDGMEKCYGISKSGMNDCAGKSHSCAGQETKDGSADSWVLVPEGTCEKIVGGVLKPDEQQQ